MYITPFGLKRRALHRYKKGGSVALLLSPGLGASNGGLSIGSGLKTGGQLTVEQEKPVIENVQKRLEALTVRGGKRKNISFKI
jgi:hypothetical protein